MKPNLARQLRRLEDALDLVEAHLQSALAGIELLEGKAKEAVVRKTDSARLIVVKTRDALAELRIELASPEETGECPRCHQLTPYRGVQFRNGTIIIQCAVCGHKWKTKAS